MYVTWGWFEDNVLSRFFSRLTDNGQGVMGERLKGVEQEKEYGLEVDTYEDLELARFYMSKRLTGR